MKDMVLPKGAKLAGAEAVIDDTRKQMSDIGVPANNNQLAIAYAAYAQLSKQRQQIYQVPAGHGKSRIIPAIARMIAYAEDLEEVPKVIVVYNDSKLLEND